MSLKTDFYIGLVQKKMDCSKDVLTEAESVSEPTQKVVGRLKEEDLCVIVLHHGPAVVLAVLHHPTGVKLRDVPSRMISCRNVMMKNNGERMIGR